MFVELFTLLSFFFFEALVVRECRERPLTRSPFLVKTCGPPLVKKNVMKWHEASVPLVPNWVRLSCLDLF